MLMIIVDHHCRAGMKEQALRRIFDNGNRMATVDGFLFRHTGEETRNPLVITTVTGWRDEASYRAWLDVKPKDDGGESPYESFVNRSFVTISAPSKEA